MTARLVLLLAALIISVDVVRDARRGRHIEARIVGLWVIFALAVLTEDEACALVDDLP